jgi:hypothetical protein
MTAIDYPPGWNYEQVIIRFERYLIGTLDHRDALAVAEHIEACVGCGQALVLFRIDRRTDLARG